MNIKGYMYTYSHTNRKKKIKENGFWVERNIWYVIGLDIY